MELVGRDDTVFKHNIDYIVYTKTDLSPYLRKYL